MAVLARKAVDLVFHAGAVARAHALDYASEHGAAIKAAADDVVRALVGVRDPARHLRRVHVGLAHEAENRHGIEIARLFGAGGKINRAPVQPGRGAGFQAALRQLQFLELNG